MICCLFYSTLRVVLYADIAILDDDQEDVFLSDKLRRTGKSQPGSFFFTHKGPVCGVDQSNFFIRRPFLW